MGLTADEQAQFAIYFLGLEWALKEVLWGAGVPFAHCCLAIAYALLLGGVIWRWWQTPVKQPAFSVLTLVLVMYRAAITGLCAVGIALAGLLSAVGPSLLPPTLLSWGRCLALFCFGQSCWPR